MLMVRNFEHLTSTDVEILRFLNGHKFPHFEAGPTLVARHIGVNPSTVSRRVKRLRHIGMLVYVDDGRHAITDLGERFLREELTDDEVEMISESIQEYIDEVS